MVEVDEMDTEKKEDTWCGCSCSGVMKYGGIIFGLAVLAYIAWRLLG